MGFKRLDINWGGYKDGVSFRLDPTLVLNNKSDFIAQAEIQKLRTARVVSRDATGFVKALDVAGEVPMGIVVQGFIDKLDTHEDYNALAYGDGEGLTVAVGRFGTTLPKSDKVFDGVLTAVVAGDTVHSTAALDGKLAIGAGDTEIGYVSLVDAETITIEFKL